MYRRYVLNFQKPLFVLSLHAWLQYVCTECVANVDWSFNIPNVFVMVIVLLAPTNAFLLINHNTVLTKATKACWKFRISCFLYNINHINVYLPKYTCGLSLSPMHARLVHPSQGGRVNSPWNMCQLVCGIYCGQALRYFKPSRVISIFFPIIIRIKSIQMPVCQNNCLSRLRQSSSFTCVNTMKSCPKRS